MTPGVLEDNKSAQLANLSRRVFHILEDPPAGNAAAQAINTSMVLLILLNVLACIFQTVDSLTVRFARAFFAFEAFSIVIFTLEYLLRLWVCVHRRSFRHPLTGRIKYAFTALSFIDLLVILPFYLPTLIPMDLRVLRLLRLIRILRVVKLARYSDSLQLLGRVLKAKARELAVTGFAALLILVVSSSLMYFAEHEAQPDVFPSIPAALWWGVVTLTTVGYGDIYPVTLIGKMLGSLIALVGIGLFALPAGILGSGFVEEMQKRKQSTSICPHCGKVIEQ